MFVEVALPLPVPRTFTYKSAEPVEIGTRVRVPFSGRRLIGWVVGPATSLRSPDKVRAIERVLDERPSVPPDVLALARWVADYYIVPLGVVLRTALPTLLSETSRTKEPIRTKRVIRLVQELNSLQQRETMFGRARRQLECFEVLEAAGGSADVAHLTAQLNFSASVLDGLVARGVAVIEEEPVARDPFAELPAGIPTAHTPTDRQREALAALMAAAQPATGTNPAEASAPAPFLLLGVTGSGKTLVYIELLKEIVARQGRGAIVLVPEIALTPQAVARFRAEFGDVIAVLHSALSDGERFDAWKSLRDGHRRIAIGARSAIFAPVRDLGAIIVDEEHEASYKQSEAPRYHARELAVVRASQANALCVLGSATPALESWYNAQRGKYTLLRLPERVEGRPLPPVQIVDLRAVKDSPTQQNAKSSQPAARPILSDPLVHAMQQRLARDEQIILLLNRRGYATFVQCRSCGAVWHCEQCNVSLTYHRARRRLVCHYCFHEEPSPVRCDACGSADLSFRGVGTEQVEREVADRFPHARIARMDVDTTSAKWAHHEILSRVEHGEIDILLGTQMIAKGLDFPRVTLVGVVNADVAMNLPDFRASERTFQLLTQVAGRAGRGPLGGDVIIQTALPQHYAIRCAVEHDFDGFAERELTVRTEPRYPPHTRMANVVISGTDERAVSDAAVAAVEWLRPHIPARADIEITGPAPCPIDRIRGRWRWHFLIRSPSAAAIGNAGRQIQKFPLRAGAADLRMVLDRDPVTLL